jgi:hypothetical protein
MSLLWIGIIIGYAVGNFTGYLIRREVEKLE